MDDPLKSGSLLEKAVTEAQLRKNEEVLDDIEVVMGTEAGRRFVWRLLQKSDLFNDAMTGNSYTYFILGQQSVVRELTQVLFAERFLLLFRKMQDEAILAMKAEKKKMEAKDGKGRN